MTVKERADTTRLAKQLYMWTAGITDEEEFKEVLGCTLDEAWELKPLHQKDDYIFAVARFTNEIMEIFEEIK